MPAANLHPLALRRKRQLLYLTDMAERTGLSRSLLCMVERGRKPLCAHNLPKLARALGTKPHILAAEVKRWEAGR